MKIKSSQLLDDLQADIRQLLLVAENLKAEEHYLLLLQPAEGKWSVTQILEHLNSYGRYYIPAMKTAMEASTKIASINYKAGWFGDFFTKLMKPKEGKVHAKMKAPKNHRPPTTLNARDVLAEFIDQQQQLLNLLQEARQKNIGKIRVATSLSTLLRLKLGDTFRFLIAHEQRHFVQLRNTLAVVTRQENPGMIATIA